MGTPYFSASFPASRRREGEQVYRAWGSTQMLTSGSPAHFSMSRDV
jgi:hypothetical protein